MQNMDVRVLIYNGDTDLGINPMVTKTSISTTLVSKASNHCVNGGPGRWTVSSEWEGMLSNPGNLSCVTIRGAGHMVAEYKPVSALAFLKAFLADARMPEHVHPVVEPPPSRKDELRGLPFAICL